ncbi:MAG: hypothetical protein JOZ81_32920 [Chloroflexi bacterium]|nr:hypothetical protein [Chloroflexota bacterium]
MVRLFAPMSLTLVVLAMALTGSATAASETVGVTTSAPGVAQATDWTHPMDVTPLTDVSTATSSVGGKAASGAGAFQVISQTPWPGDKVRVFFFGVQG